MIVNSFAHSISTKPIDQYSRPEFTGRLTLHSLSFFFLLDNQESYFSREMFDLAHILADHGPLAIDAGRHPVLESVYNDFIVCTIPLQSETCHC